VEYKLEAMIYVFLLIIIIAMGIISWSLYKENIELRFKYKEVSNMYDKLLLETEREP
jgi:hypothetical protein